MMHRDGFEFVGALIQRVDELDIAVTAEAEYLRHLFLDQIVDDDLGTIEHIARRHRITPRLPRIFGYRRSARGTPFPVINILAQGHGKDNAISLGHAASTSPIRLRISSRCSASVPASKLTS